MPKLFGTWTSMAGAYRALHNASIAYKICPSQATKILHSIHHLPLVLHSWSEEWSKRQIWLQNLLGKKSDKHLIQVSAAGAKSGRDTAVTVLKWGIWETDRRHGSNARSDGGLHCDGGLHPYHLLEADTIPLIPHKQSDLSVQGPPPCLASAPRVFVKCELYPWVCPYMDNRQLCGQSQQ